MFDTVSKKGIYKLDYKGAVLKKNSYEVFS